ncbi:MAG: 30S ribosomal protein S17 [Patescibacteria group bacterium]|nr:30S ribosomal protein S17 [Patescibacteria group bacterium]
MKTTNTTEKTITRQKFSGVVSSAKMKDTIVVTVSRYVKHAKYGKFMSKKTKLFVHDPGNTKKEGETVTVEACRPISKNKAFRLIK